MLLLGQEHWSHAEVRKLVALIATEHLRAQATFDTLPVGVGVVTPELRVIWANQALRTLVPAMQSADSAAREAVERAARTGVPTEAVVGDEQVRLQISPSKVMPGEIIIVALEVSGPAAAPQNAFAGLEHCEVPVFAYTADGRLLFVNDRAVELTGYQREMLLRLSLGELCPEHHKALLVPGECTVTMHSLSGPGIPVKCRVKPMSVERVEGFCMTVVAKEHEISAYAANLATLEGCLIGAFPDSTVSRLASSEPHRHRFRIITDADERLLSVTDAALRSPLFRTHMRELPEALNFTRTVLLAEDGVRVE